MYTLEKARLGSIKFYEEVGDVGVICRRCRISRPTLRKLRHYEKDVLEGLKGLSRKPLCSQKKITIEQEKLILSLRNERRLGVRRVQSEIKMCDLYRW